MMFVGCHRDLRQNLLRIADHKGPITRLKIEVISKKEWEYVDDEDGGIIAATIFPTESVAEFALQSFKVPKHVVIRPLTGVEKDCWGLDSEIESTPEL